MSRTNYKTTQKEQILEAIKLQKDDFLMFDIEKILIDKVSPATIYRQIKKMLEEGELQKQNISGETRYRYIGTCKNDGHFFLFCKKCNKMKHVDCGCMRTFVAEVEEDHQFEIDTKNIVFSGICKECNES